MYLWIEDRGVSSSFFDHIWKLKIPLKIQIFLWLLCTKTLLTRTKLRRSGWEGPINCVYCPNDEKIDHLFFACAHVQRMWNCLLIKFHVTEVPNSLEDFLVLANLILEQDQNAFRLCSATVLWTCWLLRNDVCFNASPYATLNTYIAKVKYLVSYWSGMWTPQVKEQVMQLMHVVELEALEEVLPL
ncbi:Ribonuclease H-like superfamily protein [Rhynchospora pubera]|uniref:Ribonuclease H-like superfamily protein n=1 Tax=Rhynchospora pubera TaxID=906938 RepID=A0AAV8G4R9_9POAL|nr:Ribonuclease H-like superfamily protein [Rhynchospora pubera]